MCHSSLPRSPTNRRRSTAGYYGFPEITAELRKTQLDHVAEVLAAVEQQADRRGRPLHDTLARRASRPVLCSAARDHDARLAGGRRSRLGPHRALDPRQRLDLRPAPRRVPGARRARETSAGRVAARDRTAGGRGARRLELGRWTGFDGRGSLVGVDTRDSISPARPVPSQSRAQLRAVARRAAAKGSSRPPPH